MNTKPMAMISRIVSQDSSLTQRFDWALYSFIYKPEWRAKTLSLIYLVAVNEQTLKYTKENMSLKF
jgi:hypothetical protein